MCHVENIFCPYHPLKATSSFIHVLMIEKRAAESPKHFREIRASLQLNFKWGWCEKELWKNLSVDSWELKPLRGTHRLCHPLCHLQVLRVRKCKIRVGKLPKKAQRYSQCMEIYVFVLHGVSKTSMPSKHPSLRGWKFASRIWLLLCGQLFFHTFLLWKRTYFNTKLRKWMKSPEKATLEGVIPSHSDSEALIEGRRKGDCSSIPWSWTQAPQVL